MEKNQDILCFRYVPVCNIFVMEDMVLFVVQFLNLKDYCEINIS